MAEEPKAAEPAAQPNVTWDAYDISAKERVVKVVVSSETVRQEVRSVVERFKRRALVKGFRRGKVPDQMVMRLYGGGIMADVQRELLGRSYGPVLEKIKDSMAGDPVIENVSVSESDGLKYELRFDKKADPAPGSVVAMTAPAPEPAKEPAPETVVVRMSPEAPGQ